MAPFALLNAFAPGFEPSDSFHRKGLKEFLAACGVYVPQQTFCLKTARLLGGNGVAGLRRFIFDVEDISQHEEAAGAKSEGLTIGPCCG